MKSDSGFTALHLAVSSAAEGALEICKFLILSGSDIDAEDGLQRTPDDLAEECGNFRAVKLFDVEPPTEEEKKGYMAMLKAKYHCQTHRTFDFRHCKRDKNGEIIITREDKVPVPIELTMPEHHIFPHAVESYGALRKDGASAIRDLVMLVDQSTRNEHRRDLLANSLEVNLRREGKLNWRKGSEDLTTEES